jgi:hypothetical protein
LDLQGVALRADGPDLNGFSRLLGRCDNRLGCKVEWNAENIGVLDIEATLLVEVIRLAAKGAANDLLAYPARRPTFEPS